MSRLVHVVAGRGVQVVAGWRRLAELLPGALPRCARCREVFGPGEVARLCRTCRRADIALAGTGGRP